MCLCCTVRFSRGNSYWTHLVTTLGHSLCFCSVIKPTLCDRLPSFNKCVIKNQGRLIRAACLGNINFCLQGRLCAMTFLKCWLHSVSNIKLDPRAIQMLLEQSPNTRLVAWFDLQRDTKCREYTVNSVTWECDLKIDCDCIVSVETIDPNR